LDLRPLRSTRIYRIGKAAKPQIGTTQNTPAVAFTNMQTVAFVVALDLCLRGFLRCEIGIQISEDYKVVQWRLLC